MARRSLKLMAVGALGALLVAGCAPPGIDGDLVNNWAAMPQPERWSPPEGDCHGDSFRGLNRILAGYAPMDCEEFHAWETYHVGTFTGEDADRVTPPPARSPEQARAYQECSDHADEFLGGKWRDGRVEIRVIYPPENGWSGGARWFRCDISEIEGMTGGENDRDKNRKGSLSGSLAGQAAPLARGCYRAEGKNDGVPVSCDKPHHYEYVGTWIVPQSLGYNQLAERDYARPHRECRSLVAKHVGVPDDANLIYRTGTYMIIPHKESWDSGDRGVNCMLWLDRRLTGSLKGAGTKGLPIN